MARKKHTAAPRNQQEIDPKAKQETASRPASPAAGDEKLANLKTLNGLLLKETMERREQVSNLSSLVDDLAADASFLSSLEREIARLVLSSRLADEAVERASAVKAMVDSASQAARSGEGQLKSVAAEKEEIKNSLDRAISVRADLEARLREAEAGNSEYRKLLEDLNAKGDADAAKILSLEDKIQNLSIVKGGLEAELVQSKEAISSLKKEEEALRLEVVKMEAGNSEYRKLHEDLNAKGNADAAKILSLEAEIQNLSLVKGGLETELVQLKEAISLLKKEEEALRLEVVKMEAGNSEYRKLHEDLNAKGDADAAKILSLEAEIQNLSLVKGGLEAELVQSKGVISSLNKEEEELRLEVVKMERKNAELVEALDALQLGFDSLNKEKEQTDEGLKEYLVKVGDLEGKIGKMEVRNDEMEKAAVARESEVARLKEEIKQLLSSLSELEGANAELQAYMDAAAVDLELQKGEAEALGLRLGEAEERHAAVQQELERLSVDFVDLQKLKKEGESSFELQLGHSSEKLDALKGTLGELTAEKEKIEGLKAVQEVEIAGIQKELEQIRSSLSEHAVANVQLQADKDAAAGDLDLQSREAEDLKLQLGEAEKSQATVQEELERISAEFGQLEKAKEEGEKSLELQLRQSSEQVDDLKAQIGELLRSKAEQEADLTGLQKEVAKLQSTVSELERICRDHSTANAQIKADKEAAQRDIVVERELSAQLKAKVGELEKRKDDILEELGNLKVKHDSLVTEDEGKRTRLSSLAVEKASLEKSLSAAQHELDDTMVKLKAAQKDSEKTLSLLKSTSKAMLDLGDDQVNVIDRGICEDAEMGEEMPHFTTEMKAIKKAFINKTEKVEDLNREIVLLQVAVAEAEKKKGGLLTWLAPAVSATAVAAAAGLAAYASKVQ